MKKKSTLSALLLCTTLISGSAAADTQNITLVYSGNLNGELEPCGCSESGNLGGIKRRSKMLKQLRSDNKDLVLISSGGLIASEASQDLIKAEFILQGMQTLSYDAIAVQWRDLAYGAEFVQHNGLPWVASNWLAGGFQAQGVIKRAGASLAVFTWLNPDKSPTAEMTGAKPLVHDDVARLQQQLVQARTQGMTTILSTDWPLAKVQKVFDLKAVDILFVRSGHEVFAEPVQQGATLVLQPGSRGMRLGKVTLQIKPQGGIAAWSDHQVIELPEKVGDDPTLADWYQAYNDRVKVEYEKRVAARKARESGQSPFAGAEACKSCHDKAYQAWQESLHAGAYGKLENVDKAFDPECLQCHTVGFNADGGFIDMAITPHLLNVQCENCHGAAAQHAASGGTKATEHKGWDKAKVCNQCHVHDHSPDFDLNKYWPRIQHGR